MVLLSINEPEKWVAYSPRSSEGGQRCCVRLQGIEGRFGKLREKTERSPPLCRRPPPHPSNNTELLGTPKRAASMQVIANGIASPAVIVTIQ